MTTTAHDGSVDPGTATGQSTSEGDVTLVPYFQPFYNLATGRLQGVEALARFRAADGLILSPAAVLTDAEPGLARRMDLEMLDLSLAQVARLQEEEVFHDLMLSVNLSEELLDHPASVTEVVDLLDRHGLPGHRLLVDVTTGMFRALRDGRGEASTRLHRFQDQEITFCLDNFTAEDIDLLADATSMRVDVIKLDPRQLVAVEGRAGGHLTRIADAVQEVGLPMVAAGVETREQLQLARDLGVEWAQGFLLGEPAPADESFSAPARLTL